MPTTLYPSADEFIALSSGDIVPVPFFDVTQEVLGTLGRLDLTLANSTTLRAYAGTGADKAAMGVGGQLRVVTANVEQSMPGGSAAGRYTIYVTTGATEISGDEDSTDYTWQLAIVKEGGSPPATPYHKVVGYLDYSGTAITRLVQTFGRRDDAPHAAVSPSVNVPALEAIMPASSTANPFQVAVGTSPVFTVGPTGAVTAMAGITATNIALSKNDRTALTLPGAAAGMTLGGDTQFYRAEANVLATPGSIAAGGYVQANQSAYVGGVLHFGISGGTSFDAQLERGSAANTLKTPGTFQVGANLGLTTNTGALLFGTTGDTNLYRASAGVLKTDGELIVAGGLKVTGETSYVGGTLGFFGATAVSQRAGWGTPSPPGGAFRTPLTYSATLKNVIDKVETLITDLRAYGLLGA